MTGENEPHLLIAIVLALLVMGAVVLPFVLASYR